MRPDATPSLVHVDALGAAGDEVALGDEESRYVSRVCRAELGATIRATDGRGSLARLTLIELRPRVRARIEHVDHEPRTRVATIWCGPPEGSRGDWLVEKLAEFGIARVQPIDTARDSWKLPSARLDRWRRLALAGLRQSRQRWCMEIADARPLEDLLEQGGHPDLRWLADPAGGRPGSPHGAAETLGVVGGAGGFSEAERSRLESAGFRAMSLAAGRLRSETAALAWAAWWAGGEV